MWAPKASLHGIRRGDVSDGKLNLVKWKEIPRAGRHDAWEEDDSMMFMYCVRKQSEMSLEEATAKAFDGS